MEGEEEEEHLVVGQGCDGEGRRVGGQAGQGGGGGVGVGGAPGGGAGWVGVSGHGGVDSTGVYDYDDIYDDVYGMCLRGRCYEGAMEGRAGWARRHFHPPPSIIHL